MIRVRFKTSGGIIGDVAVNTPSDVRAFAGVDLVEYRCTEVSPSPWDGLLQYLEATLKDALVGAKSETAPQCECGVDKAGVGGLHSDWCPKAERP